VSAVAAARPAHGVRKAAHRRRRLGLAPRLRRAAQLASDNRRDIAGVCFVLAVVAIYLSPALEDGGVFGPFDLQTHLSGLTAGIYPTVHNGIDGDIVTQMFPWYALDWHAVHAGQFPLWNDYSLLGMPQFLNFESATLSLPDLVGYLFPLRDAFLVVVAVKLAIAGTGTYVFARVVAVRPAGAAFAGVTFMLSGVFSTWIGWSMADVFAWAGYLAAFAVLAYRHPRRWRYVVLLAMACAFSVYGGFPEGSVLLAGGLAVLFAGGAIATVVRSRRLSTAGVVRVACGLAAGAALSAPLWLPGIQLISMSSRVQESLRVELALHTSVLALVPGYLGRPLSGSPGFGPTNYYETVSYVGIFAIVLALAALWRFRSRPLVVGLGAALLVTLAMTYEIGGIQPFARLANALGVGTIALWRVRMVTAFLVAVLAGLGLDGALHALARGRIAPSDLTSPPSPEPASATASTVATVCTVASGPTVATGARSSRRYGQALLGAALLVAGTMAYVAFNGLSGALTTAQHRARVASLLWPCVVTGAALLLAVVVFVVSRSAPPRPGKVLRAAVVAVLLGGQTAYLVGFGDDLNTYSHTFFPTTPATAELQSLVGQGLVGLDAPNTHVRRFGGIGFYPNVNIGYALRQFNGADPLLPEEYFENWPTATGGRGSNEFNPDITSAALARRYGIEFILAYDRLPAPAGTKFVARILGQDLYSVPGAAQFYLPAPPAGAEVTSTTHPGNYSWTVNLHTPVPTTLVLAVTALPGWHVTSDGRALAVHTYGGFMESVTVPAGRQTLEAWYWPERLSEGIGLAVVALVVLVLAPVLLLGAASLRRRGSRRAGGRGHATARARRWRGPRHADG
jgi:hypothetical protein